MSYHLWAKMWHPEDHPQVFSKPKKHVGWIYFTWSGEIFLRIFLPYPPLNIPGLKGMRSLNICDLQCNKKLPMQIERQRFFQAALVAGIWYICQAGDIELTSPKQAAKSTYGNPLSEIIMVLTIQIGAVLPFHPHALVALLD